jgi:hypothetical protein
MTCLAQRLLESRGWHLGRLHRRAVAAGLMLVASAGCGGKSAEGASNESPSAAARDGVGPGRPGTVGAPTSPAQPPVATDPPAPPDAPSDIEGEESLRVTYINARRSFAGILAQCCGSCHSKAVPTAPCGLRFDDDDDLVALQLLLPLGSAQSRFLQVILDGTMPPPGEQPGPGVVEIDELRAFIDNPAFWSTLPPDRHVDYGIRNARANACPVAPVPAVDAGATPDAG